MNNTPKIPPNNAISTSHSVGLVLAIISLVATVSGEIAKYKVDAIRLIITCMPKRVNAFRSKVRSKVASE